MEILGLDLANLNFSADQAFWVFLTKEKPDLLHLITP